MRKFGVKLFSDNFIKCPELTRSCIDLIQKGVFDYLELMALPNSFEDTKKQASEMVKGKMQVVVHAPHSSQGMNTGDKDAYQNNRHLLESAQRFADLLEAEIIILHAGNNPQERYLDETIRQFKLINDERIAVENLPQYCPIYKTLFHGTSPQEMARIKAETGCKFCYDFCHGICASNSFGRDRYEDMKAYVALKPDMYHLCDNDWDGMDDGHMHYGEGSYNLAKIVSYIDKDGIVTMETGRDAPKDMVPRIRDVEFLHKICA